MQVICLNSAEDLPRPLGEKKLSPPKPLRSLSLKNRFYQLAAASEGDHYPSFCPWICCVAIVSCVRVSNLQDEPGLQVSVVVALVHLPT